MINVYKYYIVKDLPCNNNIPQVVFFSCNSQTAVWSTSLGTAFSSVEEAWAVFEKKSLYLNMRNAHTIRCVQLLQDIQYLQDYLGQKTKQKPKN